MDTSEETPVLSEVEGQAWVQERYPVQKGSMSSLVRDFHLYIRNGDDREELYDIVNDPLEQRDLADEAVGLQNFRELMLRLQSKFSKR